MIAIHDSELSPPALAQVALVIKALEEGYERAAEAILASLTLDVLDALHAGRISPDSADQAFTFVDRYLTDHQGLPRLSADAQQLLFEGEHFHDFGAAYGPDPAAMRRLAQRVLKQVQGRRIRQST